MLGRRAFLTRLGIGAAAAPLAAKQLLEGATADLAGVTVSGVGSSAPCAVPSSGQSGGYDPRKAVRKLLTNAELRSTYTSLMFEQHRHVSALDLDIASKRSFSLAAKVTFQRQRNVERAIQAEAADVPWYNRAEEFVRQSVGWPSRECFT